MVVCLCSPSSFGEILLTERSWVLGDFEVEQTRKYKYFGVWFDESGCEGTIDKRIGRANQWLGRLSSVARMRASKYYVIREVWKGVAVPSQDLAKIDLCLDSADSRLACIKVTPNTTIQCMRMRCDTWKKSSRR